MKRSIIATAAVALAIASATGAYAKAATGTIASVDRKGDSFTLSDGKTFALPENIEVETLKVGDKVSVTYSAKAGRLLVSSVQPAN
jgi:Cu/Ag efflux protein CusF